MDTSILILTLLILIPLIYFIYYWTNSYPLDENEIDELAISQRFWDIYQYFSFADSQGQVNQEFKSALNTKGQFYRIFDIDISIFPSIAAGLLKGKKHEWILFAFSKDKKVFSFYINKGYDNQSVAPNITIEETKRIAFENKANIILEFHNHPNAVLGASKQDIISANYFGETLCEVGINFLAFVCGRGNFIQYSWWFIDSFFPESNYLKDIENNNGKTRSQNFQMRKELKRKNYVRTIRLNVNASHNIY